MFELSFLSSISSSAVAAFADGYINNAPLGDGEKFDYLAFEAEWAELMKEIQKEYEGEGSV
jgi:hypothetical protein